MTDITTEYAPGWDHFRVKNWVLERYGARLGPCGFAVWSVLAMHADAKTGRAFPGLRRIGELTGVSERQARRELQKIVDLKLARREEVPGRVARYYLAFEDPARAPSKTPAQLAGVQQDAAGPGNNSTEQSTAGPPATGAGVEKPAPACVAGVVGATPASESATPATVAATPDCVAAELEPANQTSKPNREGQQEVRRYGTAHAGPRGERHPPEPSAEADASPAPQGDKKFSLVDEPTWEPDFERIARQIIAAGVPGVSNQRPEVIESWVRQRFRGNVRSYWCGLLERKPPLSKMKKRAQDWQRTVTNDAERVCTDTHLGVRAWARLNGQRPPTGEKSFAERNADFRKRGAA